MNLETKRLILRKPRKSDWKDLLEGMNQKEVSRMLFNPPHPYKKKHFDEYFKEASKEWSKKKKYHYPFVIELKSEKKVIGTFGIGMIDYFQGIATGGSWINKKYWKKGYMTEAKIAINDFVFNELKLRRLRSIVFTHNKASIKLQEKTGYKLEGKMRKSGRVKIDNKVYDEYIYGLLKEDWKKVRPKLIKEMKKIN